MESMIAEAEKTLGMSGRPNPITRDYAGRDGSEFLSAPWCDMGVTYWARHAREFSAVCLGVDFAYTVAHAAALRDAGIWNSGAAGIRRGDIVFFNWDGGGLSGLATIDHVGICTGTQGSSTLTIEANTGDVVARRLRGPDVIVGYGRPHYSQAPPEAWPTVSLAHLVAAFRHDLPAAQGSALYRQEARVLEDALVRLGLLAPRWADGSAGSATWAAYSVWQQSAAGGSYRGTQRGQAADGCPGWDSLTRLGVSQHFHVVR